MTDNAEFASEYAPAGEDEWLPPQETSSDPWQAVTDTLESVTASVSRQAGRVDVVEKSLGELAAAVKQLMEQEKKRKPRRYRFDALDEAGKRKLWLEIAEFVDYLNNIFGTSAYTSHREWQIPDWWWKQPIVVFELVALKASWDEAFTSTTPNAPTNELIAWIDRWYWPCMNRIFNNKWGLKVSPAPDDPGTKFSVENIPNQRDEFDAFLLEAFGPQSDEAADKD